MGLCRHVAPVRALPPLPAHFAPAAAISAAADAPFKEKKQQHRSKEKSKTFFAPVFMIGQQQQQQRLQQQQSLHLQEQNDEFTA
jgi:hypothetical protein